MMLSPRALLGCLLACAAASPVPAQAPAARVQVMVLGVFHFANPNADYAQFRGIDVLTPDRQREIEDVVTGLARYAPTKIALERVPAEADTINAQYRRYRAGAYSLTRNEIHQLGFRLAARLGHAQVYPVDFSAGLRIDSVMAYAQQHDTGFVSRMNRLIGGVVRELDRMQREETIAANLRFMNAPEALLRAEEPYMDMAAVGAHDTYIGARVVADWYARNLHIFANLARLCEPGDRLLVIIGQGHAPILRALVRSHPRMELVEPLPYLP